MFLYTQAEPSIDLSAIGLDVFVDHRTKTVDADDRTVDEELTALAGDKGELIKVTIKFTVTFVTLVFTLFMLSHKQDTS